MKQRLKQLIAEYVELVQRAHNLFAGKYSYGNLLVAYREKQIPKSGFLDTEKKIAYNFHGIGCRIDFDGVEINFDFGPGGRHDGFDVWRLYSFAESSDRYSEFGDMETLRGVFEVLIEDGFIECPEWSPSPHLFYRTADIEGVQGG